jgi:hypothetical protein
MLDVGVSNIKNQTPVMLSLDHLLNAYKVKRKIIPNDRI